MAKVLNFRTLVSSLMSRADLAALIGRGFGRNRDYYKALGYERVISQAQYREEFRRNAVAARIVEAMPKATWRAGGELIEDNDPENITAFETAWNLLDEKFQMWSLFERADTLAGLGHYAILLVGAPGDLSTPLLRCSFQQLAYFTPYSEEDSPIQKSDLDSASPRFGMPSVYGLRRITETALLNQSRDERGRPVDWTRVFHIADGLLDSHSHGIPRLERCWNLVAHDLIKVVGGGAEAFWKRVDGGKQFDIDPEMDLDPAATADLQTQIDEYEHGLKRILRTRGMTIKDLGSNVADFKSPVEAIISLISAGTGIPQRILLGSEQGRLASVQDHSNWQERVIDRRRGYAGPQVVRPFVNRMVDFGVLPKPTTYEIRWPEIQNLDEGQRAEIANQWAAINHNFAGTVVTANEIRDRILGLDPLDEAENPAALFEAASAAAKAAQKRWMKKKFYALTARERMAYLKRKKVA